MMNKSIEHSYHMFWFEQNFNSEAQRQWMLNNWQISLYSIAAYLFFIFGGRVFMNLRPRFELRAALAFWNVALAIFSTVGALRVLPEYLYSLREYGYHYSVCNPSFVVTNKVSGYWTWLFTLSKIPELFDTVFIVLRKQKLIFLHWYHHAIVVFYCWYTYHEHTAMVRWFICMNYSVHGIMYAYYAMRALKIQVPRPFAMLITCLQILQMVVACVISVYTFFAKLFGFNCHVTLSTALASFLMYLSFFGLFVQFFVTNYYTTNKVREARNNGLDKKAN